MMSRNVVLVSVLGIASVILVFVALFSLVTISPEQVSAQSLGATPIATLTVAQMTGLPPLSPQYPFEDTPNPGIPTLQQIIGDAQTDDVALQRILAYYDDHVDQLRTIFDESNPDRLKALYAMYVIHISEVYGQVAVIPTSLVSYLQGEYSHCGLYTRFQAEIMNAFGMPWRIFNELTEEHAWIEVPIDGTWEVFDSTVNVWISTDGYSLIAGAPRTYRMFYTPMNDPTRPDAREHYWRGPNENPRIGWYNMPRLRDWMPALGLTYIPGNGPQDVMIHSSSPGAGSDRNAPWSDGQV